jgi:hypothetical protein
MLAKTIPRIRRQIRQRSRNNKTNHKIIEKGTAKGYEYVMQPLSDEAGNIYNNLKTKLNEDLACNRLLCTGSLDRCQDAP